MNPCKIAPKSNPSIFLHPCMLGVFIVASTFLWLKFYWPPPSGCDAGGRGALGSSHPGKVHPPEKVPPCDPGYATVCCTTPGHVITSLNS